MKEQRTSTQIAQFFMSNRRKRNWRKVVTSMAAVVVFCVTYALILPAITMEAKPVCALEEHTHTEDCYEIVRTLVCENIAEDHVHTEECWKVEQKLICGKNEHIHTDACYARETEPESTPLPEAEPLKAPVQEPVVRSVFCEIENGSVFVEGIVPAGTPEELVLKVATLEDKDTEAERTALCAAGVDLSAEGTRAWFFMPQVSHADTQVTLSGPVSVRLRINGVSAANDPYVYMFSAGNAAVKEIVLGEDDVISFTADALGCTALVYKEATAPELTPEATAEPTPEVTPEATAEPTPEVTPEPTAEPVPEATPVPTEAPAGTPVPTEAPAVVGEEAETSEYSFTFEDPSAYLSNILKLSGAKLKGEYAEISVEPAGLVYLDKRDEQIKTGLFGMKKLGEEQLLTAVTSFDKAVLVLKNENEEVRIDLHNPKTEADFVPFTGEANGISVYVQAPAGALPEGTDMLVLPVNDEKLLNIAGSAVDGEVKNIVAVDISFWNDGTEIEPILPVQVKLSSDFIRAASDPQIVHVPDKGTVEVISTDAPGPEANDITFASKTFSVYAVVETGDGGDYARATVNFYGKDTSNPIATVFVKNSDDYDAATDTGKLTDIVYDPGNGELESTELFDGWSISTVNTTDGKNYALKDDDGNEIKGKTIEDVRKYLAELDIKEGDVVNIYARIVKYYTVTYIGETQGVVLGSETQKLLQTDSTIDYTVNMAYTPATNTQNFDGWFATQGSSNISQAIYGEEEIASPYTSTTLFPNGTTMKLSGNVQFSVSAPAGHWLVFDENGKGATYNAPQFVKDGENTREPALEMTRLGYTFGGWYTDEDCTEGYEFTFGNQLTDNTTIYAKWTQVETANYTIIVWKQNVSGKDAAGNKLYDFEEAIQLSGATNSTVNTISQQGTDNNAYARINGINYRYTGFHLNSYDQGKTIAPEGSTVVNVYYDRTEYSLTFQADITTYTYRITTRQNTGNYYIPDGNGGYEQVYLYYYNGTFYRTRIDGGCGRDDTYSDPYTGDRYDRIENSGLQPVKTITALYEQNISDQFPIVGDNGVTYNNGERWKPGTNNQGWSEVMVIIDIMPAENITFTLDEADRPLKTMYYYVEALPGATGTITHKGTAYSIYNTISARYNGVTAEDYIDLDGFTKADVAATIGGQTLTLHSVQGLSGQYYIASTTLDQTIYFFYSRDSYKINYLDGSYFDGNGNPIEDPPVQAPFGVSEGIYYQADISSYGKGGENYNSPEYAEYTFAGWYIDKSCTQEYDFTTMPKGGVTVYAKWILNQYRVFLHPNAGTDPTLDWGSDDQDINFRVSSGSKVSAPTGTRLEYEFIGWYLDEACTQVFSADNFVLNETTVTALYDKTDPANYTDPMDKWGNNATYNSDATGYNGGDRFWITKKFDLYAKWRAILVGADGIGVIYDLNGGSGSVSDTNLYPDNTKAIAQGAAIPPDNTQQFLYWVVQDWDENANNGEGAYVDTDIHVYPGANYTVLKSLAKDVLEGTDSSGKEIHSYTMRLRAQYGPKEEATPTHITWYDNFTENPVEGRNYITDAELQINDAVDIEPADLFTRPGYKFLGWARVNTTDAEGHPLEGYTLSPKELTSEDLFLKYENGKFYAQDSTGEWVEVTQVAADEILPYHDLYAVWEKTYTVTVKKIVSSELTEDADSEFEFMPVVSEESGEAFVLKHTETKAFAELKKGTKFTVTEVANSDFTTSVKYTVTGAEAAEDNVDDAALQNGDELVIKGDTLITFTNTRKTVSITITKTDKGTGEALNGAEFNLRIKTSAGTYVSLDEAWDGITAGSTDISGLPSGTYQLIETKAPNGYIVAANTIDFTVAIDENGKAVIAVADGTENALAESSELIITNIPGEPLPMTGGIGTHIYTLSGLVLMAGALMYGFRMRRRERRNE